MLCPTILLTATRGLVLESARIRVLFRRDATVTIIMLILHDHAAARSVCAGSDDLLRESIHDLHDRLIDFADTIVLGSGIDEDAAHALSGYCAMLHCRPVAELLLEIENKSRDGTPADPVFLAALLACCRDTAAALREAIQQRP